MIKQEIEGDRLDKDNKLEEENPYQDMIINSFEKNNVDRNVSQMEQWKLLSKVINQVQYNRNLIDYYKLDIKALGPKCHKRICGGLEEDDRQVTDLDFGQIPEKMKGECLNVYEGVRSEILYTTKFDENSDLGPTNLGNENMGNFRSDKSRRKTSCIRVRLYSR